MTRQVQNERTSGRLRPESAVAKIHDFIKEDLHRSVSDFFYCDGDRHLTKMRIWQQPLPGEKKDPVGKRLHRDVEQYLMRLIEVLHTAMENAANGDGKKWGGQLGRAQIE